MKQNFLLCWMREPLPGVIQADLGLEVTPEQIELAILGLHPEQLPVMTRIGISVERLNEAIESWDRFESTPRWFQKTVAGFFGQLKDHHDLRAVRSGVAIIQTVANRIRNLAPEGGIEIHLPNLSRRNWPSRIDLLRRAEFVREDARIVVKGFDPDSFEQGVMRIAAASYSQSNNAIPITVETECDIPSIWAHRLAAHYGIDHLPADASISQIRVSALGAEMDSWSVVPRERSLVYSRCITRLSQNLQAMFRAWLPALWLSAESGWSDSELSTDMLVYASTPPFVELPRYRSYDVLDPNHLQRLLERTSRRFPATMEEVAAYWNREGRPDRAKKFTSRDMAGRAQEIVKRALYRNKVRSLIVTEAAVVDALVSFMQRVKALDHSRHMGPILDAVEKGTKIHLGRMVPAKHLEFMRRLVMIEATHALQVGLRREPKLDIRLEDEAGESYCNARTLCDSLSPI